MAPRKKESIEQKVDRAPQRKAAISRAQRVLDMSGQTARERHAEKRNLVLRWIYEFGYICPDITNAILAVKSGKEFLKRLAKSGDVRLIIPRAKLHPDCPVVVAVLTEFGIVRVERGLSEPDDLMSYPLDNPINQNKLAHDTLVQRIAVKILTNISKEHNIRLQDAIMVMFNKPLLFTDRRLTIDPTTCNGKVPDLFIKAHRMAADLPVDLYVELELTAKKEQALYRSFVKAYDELLQDKGYTDDTQNDAWVRTEWAPDLWLFTDSPAAGRKYRLCMKDGSNYPLYFYDKKTRSWKHLKDHNGVVEQVEFSGEKNIEFHDLFTFLDARD